MFAQHFASHRIAWSRVVIGRAPASWCSPIAAGRRRLGGRALRDAGFALLAVAALWRIWCALFIAGTKNGELCDRGTVLVVRNPLYLGNFAGVVGFGFAVEQPASQRVRAGRSPCSIRGS